MPADRIDIDVSLVRRLVTDQFPRWADLPITPADPMGWDNYTYRLGSDMKVRLPSAARYASQTEKEHRWLPKLAPRLPLPIPAPLVIGEPADRYPWPWSISRWIEGDTATLANIDDLSQFATDLAQFLVALQQIDRQVLDAVAAVVGVPAQNPDLATGGLQHRYGVAPDRPGPASHQNRAHDVFLSSV